MEILGRWDCETVASLFIVDGGSVADAACPTLIFGEEFSMLSTASDELLAHRSYYASAMWFEISDFRMCRIETVQR